MGIPGQVQVGEVPRISGGCCWSFPGGKCVWWGGGAQGVLCQGWEVQGEKTAVKNSGPGQATKMDGWMDGWMDG